MIPFFYLFFYKGGIYETDIDSEEKFFSEKKILLMGSDTPKQVR